MIGIIKYEERVIIQFWPIFASKLNKHMSVRIPYDPKNYGEYGIAWNFHWDRIPDVWISWNITTFTSFKSFLNGWRNA